jgi:hypothetical protein
MAETETRPEPTPDSKVSKEKLAELKAEHGEIYVHEKSGIAYRQPNQAEMRLFINSVARGKADLAIVMENLARQCAVHPDAIAVATIFKQKPGYPLAVVPRLQEMAGLEDDDPKL